MTHASEKQLHLDITEALGNSFTNQQHENCRVHSFISALQLSHYDEVEGKQLGALRQRLLQHGGGLWTVLQHI